MSIIKPSSLIPPSCNRFQTITQPEVATYMQIIFMLILISLVIGSGFLLAYLGAARAGQFDDDYTPSIRILFDDTIAEEKQNDEVQ